MYQKCADGCMFVRVDVGVGVLILRACNSGVCVCVCVPTISGMPKKMWLLTHWRG